MRGAETERTDTASRRRQPPQQRVEVIGPDRACADRERARRRRREEIVAAPKADADRPARNHGGDRRLDPQDDAAVPDRARHPERTLAECELAGNPPETDPIHDLLGDRVDPRKRLVAGVRHPHRAVADRDRGRPGADWDGPDHRVPACVDHGQRIGRGDERRARPAAMQQLERCRRCGCGEDKPAQRDEQGGAARGQPARQPHRRAERRVLVENRPLELLERRTRLEPKLVDEHLAAVTVGRQRVSLATAAIESEHELRPQPLAHRMRTHERLQLGDETAVATECELRLDALLEGGETKLLETSDLHLGERLVGEVAERRPAPKVERLAQRLRRACGVAAREQLAPLVDEPLEPLDIDRIGPQLERVARPAPDEQPVAEHPAQAGNVDLQGLRRARRRRLAPELVDEPVD